MVQFWPGNWHPYGTLSPPSMGHFYRPGAAVIRDADEFELICYSHSPLQRFFYSLLWQPLPENSKFSINFNSEYPHKKKTYNKVLPPKLLVFMGTKIMPVLRGLIYCCGPWLNFQLLARCLVHTTIVRGYTRTIYMYIDIYIYYAINQFL